ncbi:MAG: hypothetical protein J2P57_16740 [Acidimicrobiaceae bacterium]|nr:hypothetical protein [Acidimicrobiaceae bacterium]
MPGGLYVDGPRSQPHYVVSMTNNVGRLSFVYQNGRTAQAGSFTASVSSGRLSAHFSGGQVLTGTVGTGTFALSGCQAVLKFAIQPHSCTFTRQA